MARTHPLVRRQCATEATKAKFGGRPFAWGSVDCMKMVAFHLRQLGHTVPLSKGGQYRSALGAKAALRRAGYETVMDVMDGLGLERIAPASALIGDVISAPAEGQLGGLGIMIGNGNALVFHESHAGLVIIAPNLTLTPTAWRALK